MTPHKEARPLAPLRYGPPARRWSDVYHRGHQILLTSRGYCQCPTTAVTWRSAPSDARRNESTDERTTSLVRSWSGVRDSRSQECHPRTWGIEAAQQPIPNSNRCLPKHPNTKQSENEPGTDESPDFQALDKLIQRLIKEAKLQFDN